MKNNEKKDPNSSLIDALTMSSYNWKTYREINSDLVDYERQSVYEYLNFKVEKDFIEISDYRPYHLQFFVNKGYNILQINEKRVIFTKLKLNQELLILIKENSENDG